MPENAKPGPRLSIVVPTCRRAAALRRCLSGLADQSLPAGDLEIIVVDDSGALSRTDDAVGIEASTGVKLIRHAENSGAGAARNSGAKAARARHVAFIDDDCVAATDWAEKLLHRFALASNAAVAGSVVISEPQRATDRVTQLLSAPEITAEGDVNRAQTANLALPLQGFLALGGFDERFRGAGYEDYEFCRRWRQAGRRIVPAPEAVVHHIRKTTLAGFWRQHYRYGKGAHLHYSGREGAPRPSSSSVWARMTRAVVGGNTLVGRLQNTGLVGLSQLAMLTGFTVARFTRP